MISGTAAADRNRIAGPGYGDVGSPIGTRWLITPTTRYPANCTGPGIVPMAGNWRLPGNGNQPSSTSSGTPPASGTNTR